MAEDEEGAQVVIYLFWRCVAWLCCVTFLGHEEPESASEVRTALRNLPYEFEMKPRCAQISCARCGFMMDMSIE